MLLSKRLVLIPALALVFFAPLSLMSADIPTVLDFGAVGDGETDDTAAFKRAVDSLDETGGALRIPRGTYILTETIKITLDETSRAAIHGEGPAKIIMRGGGPAFHLVGTHGGTAAPRTMRPNIWSKQRMPIVSGIEIVGEHEEANGIELTGTVQAIISQVLVRHCQHAIHLTKRNRNVIISDCNFYENRGIGVFLDHCDLHQINIGDTHISYNDLGGVVTRGGSVRNIQVGNCDIESNMASGSGRTGNFVVDLSESGSAGEMEITGSTLQHNNAAPEGANILLRGRKGAQVEYVTIGNNILSDVKYNIQLEHARAITITGNTLFQGHRYDIHAVDSDNIVATGNVIERRMPNRNPDRASSGVVFERCTDSIFSGNTIRDIFHRDAALVMRDCQRFNVSAVSILSSDGGILWENVSDSTLTSCRVHDLRENPSEKPPFVVRNSEDNIVEANNFTF